MSEYQPIFDTTGYQKGVAWHNVSGVLRAANTEVATSVEHHYGKRAGHIPNAPQIGILVSNPSDKEVLAQMEYQSRLIGKTIAIDSLHHQAQPQERTLAVPYINTPQAESLLHALGMEVWGLPAAMVDKLKNKASCHNLITAAGIENFCLPDHYICQVDELPEVGKKLLTETESMYTKTGLLSHYPLGLMVRTAESDGNYGAAVLVEKPNGINILPDGKTEQLKVVPDWTQALSTASQLLSDTLNLPVENRVVVSRLMDLADSPGESVVIVNGQVTSLGWNGQVQDQGSSACVGTSSYQPASDYLRRVHEENVVSHTQALVQFLKYVAHNVNVDFNTINGIANVDWMIPGYMENEFQRRLGKTPGMSVAEINPRFTNWTDAILLTMWAKGLDQTLPNMGIAIAEQILAVDKLSVPIHPNVPISAVRDEISELDQRLQQQSGSRVILRMPDKPNMGVIFTGNIIDAKKQTEELVRAL